MDMSYVNQFWGIIRTGLYLWKTMMQFKVLEPGVSYEVANDFDEIEDSI